MWKKNIIAKIKYMKYNRNISINQKRGQKMAIYKCKSRIGLEDVGYSNKITNKAIIKILENLIFKYWY